jgi:hypothetical protein
VVDIERCRGSFGTNPFCITADTGAGGKDGRGDIRDDGSLEGDILSDEGPLILS